MKRRMHPTVSLSAAAILFSLAALLQFSVIPAFAEDPPVKKDADAGEEKKQPAVETFAVPDGDAKQLLAFIAKVEATRYKTQEGRMNGWAALIEAADKLLAANPEEAAALTAVQTKSRALIMQANFGDDTAETRFREFIEQLEKDERPSLVNEAALQKLSFRVQRIHTLKSREENLTLFNDVVAFLKEKRGATRPNFRMAQITVRQLEYVLKPEDAAKAYRELAAACSTSDDENVIAYLPKLEGSARRVTLIGNPIEIEGVTVEGETFNWKKYEGKVVLVDFWATWCGPCIRELPNVLENYEIYHDRGFEVVGVSLDTDKEKLVKFDEERNVPWVSLFGTTPETQGWNHPVAAYYGVSAIPTVILVNQEGKVVSLQARGDELDRLLAELLGPPEKDSEEKPDPEK